MPAHVDEREASGHKIGTYQTIQFKIADVELHTARLAYYAAAEMLRGPRSKKEAASA